MVREVCKGLHTNAEVQDQDIYRVGVFSGLFPWLADGSLLCVSYCHPLVCVVYIPISFLYKDSSHFGLLPTHMTSFNLIIFFKALTSNTVTLWELGLNI